MSDATVMFVAVLAALVALKALEVKQATAKEAGEAAGRGALREALDEIIPPVMFGG